MKNTKTTRSFLKASRGTSLIVGNTVILVLVLELLLRLAFLAYDHRPTQPQLPSVDPRSTADVYGGADWADEYWTEFRESGTSRWEPYVYWRRKQFSGDYINVSTNGFRETWNVDSSRDGLSIIVFGGSTVWGTGARDDHTIPSLVSKRLAKSGLEAHVTNLGESGYVSTQELVLLIRLLQQGWKPDVVVFYDGVNDSFSAYQQHDYGLPQNEGRRRKEFNSLRNLNQLAPEVIRMKLNSLALSRFVNGIRSRLSSRASAVRDRENNPTPPVSSESGGLAQRVVETYFINIRIVNSLGELHGFRTLFYWQPTVFSKPVLTAYEQKVDADIQTSFPGMKDFFADVYSEVRRSRPQVSGFRDLSSLFDQSPSTAYVDWCHLGEEGNEVVAAQIARDILSMLGKQTSGAEQGAAPDGNSAALHGRR